jgi:hypothetical protein
MYILSGAFGLSSGAASADCGGNAEIAIPKPTLLVAAHERSEQAYPAIRAGLRAARQISHCRRNGEISAGANGLLRSRRSVEGSTSATGSKAGMA